MMDVLILLAVYGSIRVAHDLWVLSQSFTEWRAGATYQQEGPCAR